MLRVRIPLEQKRFQRHSLAVKLVLVVVLAVYGGGLLSIFTHENRKAFALQNPAAVVAASYQAMDAAMNAGLVARHPQSATVDPHTLLTGAQVHTSHSTAGAFLYSYDLYRIQSFRSWEALHTRDYAAVNVSSTFQPTATTINGSQATVVGDEMLTIDETIQNDGLAHHFGPAKQAAQAELRRTGHLIAFGQINHSRAIIHHSVTLSLDVTGWVIEQDTYWDPLVQALVPNHHEVASQLRQTGKGRSTPHVIPLDDSSLGYNRQAAINFADYWWNSCNPNYSCYMSQDVDCANFVSQVMYDGSGGNLNGDNTWYPDSYAFVNADGLHNYALSAWAADSYGTYDHYSAWYWQNMYVYPGDLDFYDWGYVFGFGAPDGVMDHTAFTATQDGNGDTYVDAHTTNLYHYPWDLGGGSSTGYFFVVVQ